MTPDPAVIAALAALRDIIRETGKTAAPAGLIETTKWGQPAFLSATPRTGTTVRIDALPAEPGKVAIFFHCKTSLVERFRSLFPNDFEFRGNRALVLDAHQPLPHEAIATCVALALTYYKPAARA